MKARVDPELCTGCCACAQTCPEVFEMDGDLAQVIVDIVPVEEEKACAEAAAFCPVGAITLE